jgi:hypothetical protein
VNNLYDVSKISAPVFTNLLDYWEFRNIVRAYVNNPTEHQRNYLKKYFATNEKMLNPVGEIEFHADEYWDIIDYDNLDLKDMLFCNGNFNSHYVGDGFDLLTCKSFIGDNALFNVKSGLDGATKTMDSGHGMQALGTSANPWMLQKGELVRTQSIFNTDAWSSIFIPIHLTEEQLTNHKVYINMSVMINGQHKECPGMNWELKDHTCFSCSLYELGPKRYGNDELLRLATDPGISSGTTYNQYVTLRSQLAPYYNDVYSKEYHRMPGYIEIQAWLCEEVRINKIWITVE